ncbi:bifunctional diguanylate cyclase/phosphodiesterase [Kutzneria buriramensis]|uniref:PAS domain S-box-containing protein/diguanylate cyclase (GGDEF)-like protein n=1 Tax=Kutzneria buriramensis TaxID=1045776 RepID=A0A3E0I0J1_9PSEU|nr:bifunctional diguanylate cyclase/phosphodiesterase [Kutzneria buriramensis]REH52213.1 PAS domain S-box-containing protein/diguanylate cyclase (GGDEF)-like protein [Kutzneria buriramensis]
MTGEDEQGGSMYPGLAEFARLWTGAVLPTSNVPLSRGELNVILTGFAELLMTSLHAEQFDHSPALEVGRGLVASQLVGPKALDATIRVLSRYLRSEADDDRLVDLLGAVAGGYVDALRDHIFLQQETLKKAVFRARDAAEKALRASERRFRTVFTESVVGIAIGDIQGHIVNSNLAMQEMLGYSADELRQRTPYDLMPRKDAEEVSTAYRKLINGQFTSLRSEQQMLRSDNEPIWVHIAVTLIKDENGLPDYPVVMIEDITDLHLLQDRWSHQVAHDPLTNLHNRALFMSKVETAVGGLGPGDRIGLACFGLDGLSVINAGASDQVGDKILKTAADRLRAVVDDDTGLLGRVDGDRFALLAVRSSTQGMIDVVERAMARIAEPVLAAGREYSVTSSVGIVERAAAGSNPFRLLADAELALQWAKRDGRAQWQLFEADRGSRQRRDFELAAQLPAALRGGQFAVEFEPVARVANRGLAGFSLVVSWDHPEQGMLSAKDFLHLAERTGHMLPLGSWALRQACDQAREWHDEHGDRTPPLSVALSDRMVGDQDLSALLLAVLDASGARAEQLVLEVSPDMLRDADGDPAEVLTVLTDLGFKVLVGGMTASCCPHGFGGLPLHGVKLAPEFVATLGEDDKPEPSAERAIGGVVSAAQLAELPVHAAGVHHERHAVALRELGVELGQGDWFGPPSLPFEVEPMIIAGTVDPDW